MQRSSHPYYNRSISLQGTKKSWATDGHGSNTDGNAADAFPSVLIRATNGQNLCFLRKLSSAEISALLNTNPTRICNAGLCVLCVSAFLNWMPFTDSTACPFLETQRRRERGEFLIVNQAFRFTGNRFWQPFLESRVTN